MIKCNVCKFETLEPEKYFSKRNKKSKNLVSPNKGFQYTCKKCAEHQNSAYSNTEQGFMKNTFNSMKKKINNKRYKNLLNKEKLKCYLTWEEFIELWEQHKQKFGYTCRLTGIEIICKRSKYKKNYIGFLNGVSVDRLNPNIGYTKENVIFISNECNRIKNAVTKELCEAILKLYKEKGL